MRLFAELIQQLDQTNKTLQKVKAITAYFEKATEADQTWALAILMGRRPRRTIRLNLLWEWTAMEVGLPPWLLEESYHVVGDFAETIALLLPEAESSVNRSLAYYMELIMALENNTDEEKKSIICTEWDQMTYYERFVFLKLITGGFRIGVSHSLVIKAISNYTKVDANAIAHRLSGDWSPLTTSFHDLLFEGDLEALISRPYPFYLAYALEQPVEMLGNPEEWQVEWKWDGIRSQLIKRGSEVFLWSRGEDLITDKFPEFKALKELLPEGTAIDGELLIFSDEGPLSFNVLQTRIGRKNLSPKMLKELPAKILAYDLLEYEGKDIREKPFTERRQLLETLVNALNSNVLAIAEPIRFKNWDELIEIRLRSRENAAEGLMLKRKSSPYETGRRKGNWWKWKIDPLTVDAVLIYAQRGHGRRANLYTDYTFAVWDNGILLPFTKAYSGLTDKELVQVDAFIKKNTREKFGPVRNVTPTLVFEIAFEGINASKRHKSGIALRFPRILRWRTDKKAEEADNLDYLRELLKKYGSNEPSP